MQEDTRSSYEEAFLKAFEENADGLFRHALYRVSDRERARDLTQDTFLRAWDYLADGGTINQYKSFLYRILHNLIVDEYRKKRELSLDEMLEDEQGAPAIEERLSHGSVRDAEETLDDRMLFERVRSRIPELSEQYRQVLTLRFLDGLSIVEIAETIGVSENVVSVRIHRGIAKLRVLSNGL